MLYLIYCGSVDVYERLVKPGKKAGFFQLLTTQTVSAVWHVSMNCLRIILNVCISFADFVPHLYFHC